MTYADMILDPSVSDEELANQATKELAERWKSETKEGREFARFFASRRENINKFTSVFDLLDEAVTFETLSAAYRTLRENGEILSEQEVEQARLETERQQDQANRIKWQNDCQTWIDAHTTWEIAERSKTDPAFRAYLKTANRLPQLPVEYSAENLARQRKAEKIQKERDRQDADVPEEVRAFAAQYQKMPFAEVQKQMRDPQFRAQIELAARAGLI